MFVLQLKFVTWDFILRLTGKIKCADYIFYSTKYLILWETYDLTKRLFLHLSNPSWEFISFTTLLFFSQPSYFGSH